MKTHFSASELAGVRGMPTTSVGVTFRARSEAWPREKRSGRGGGWVYPITCLPLETQAALVLRFSPPPANDPTHDARRGHLWSVFERKPQRIRDEAERRRKALIDALALMELGHGKVAADRAVAANIGEHPSTIRRWWKLVEGFDRSDWLAALAPAWNGRTKTAEISVEAWDYFKSDYLRDSKPRAARSYGRLQEAAAVKGWTIPHLRTLERRIARELHPAAIIAARRGDDALARTRPAQRRDHTVLAALDLVNGDGHRFDVFCKDKDGTVFRPWLWAWQDVYSGRWLAWRVGYAECAEIVRLSMADLVRNHDRAIPRGALIDNTRAAAAKSNTGGIPNRYRFKFKEEEPEGVFTRLGIEIRWATPYHGQAKPIERGWQDVIEEIAKHPLCTGAYTGPNTVDKPDSYGSSAVPLDDFIALVNDRMRAINARTGRRSPSCAGRSFDETFADSFGRVPIRTATDQQLRTLLLAAQNVTAHKESGAIHLYGNVYWSGAAALARRAGTKVTVRFDPQNLNLPVHVYDPRTGAYLGAADLQEKAGFNDIDAAKKWARAVKSHKRAIKDQLAAERTMSGIELAQMLPPAPEPAPTEAKVIRPLGFAAKTVQQPIMSKEERDAAFSQFAARLQKEG